MYTSLEELGIDPVKIELLNYIGNLIDTMSEAMETEKKIIKTLEYNLIQAAAGANDYAELKDLRLNNRNYTVAMQFSNALRQLGLNVETLCDSDGNYIKILEITIDGKEIYSNK